MASSNQAAFGKRIHGALYVAAFAVDALEEPYRAALGAARALAPEAPKVANVVKFELPRKVSFLEYEDLLAVPFPALRRSYAVDLQTGKVATRDFQRSLNPPILHRKELLLPSAHPDRPRFAALTAALEAEGLLEESRLIGFRNAWKERLEERGFRVEGDRLIQASKPVERRTSMPAEVQRHRTAIARDRLSAPMQALARYGFLSAERTVLDFGCGQGDDVAILREAAVPAIGWDPHFAPDTPLEPAEIVNLGFVLNVIEEPPERRDVLEKAFALANRCLAVAVLIVGKGDVSGLAPYRDGFLTRRGTFQKYFRQEEAKELIEQTLEVEAIPVGPGVYFAFKDPMAEQEFLLARQARRIDASLLAVRRRSEWHAVRHRRDLELLRPLLERLWEEALALGREPAPDEVSQDLASTLAQEVGSIRKAMKLCASQFDSKELDRAKADRREDLLVYFALNLFNGRKRYTTLPDGLQRDVKAHFGSHAKAQEESRALLFDTGRPELIGQACQQAADAGLGAYEEGHALQLHSALIPRLPALLRCYVGCAARLYGDVSLADLVKIHVRSGKLTLLFYEDFSNSPLPKLCERIKIDMRAQEILFFNYTTQPKGQILYLKSRYLASDQENYDAQKLFDVALGNSGIADFSGFGPRSDDFLLRLERANYYVRGFHLVKRRVRAARGETP